MLGGRYGCEIPCPELIQKQLFGRDFASLLEFSVVPEGGS